MKFLPAVAKVAAPISNFAVKNKRTLLMVGAIGTSVTTTYVTFENAPKIQEIIKDTKSLVATARDEDDKKQIYRTALKELAPLVLPILLLQASTIGFSVMGKVAADNQLADAASALAVANNTIASYRAFQKEASKELGEAKTDKILNSIETKDLEKHPQTEENTTKTYIPSNATANMIFKYYDTLGGRYFYSEKSPSTVTAEFMSLLVDLKQGKYSNYNDRGNAFLPLNDIYRLFGSAILETSIGDEYGIPDEEVVNEDIDKNLARDYMRISGHADPQNEDELVWYVTINVRDCFPR